MVKVGAASGTSDDTTGVVTEDCLVSLDGNGDGTKSDGIKESPAVVGRNIVVALHLDNTITSVLAGGVEHSSVGVVGLSSDGSGLSIVESTVHETAAA